MAFLMTPGSAGKLQLSSTFSGCAIVPSPVQHTTRKAAVAALAGRTSPNWKLEKPNRLWEGGETWFPGASAPEYLDGTLAGDRGFDPLRLAESDEFRPWLVEAELYNGRVAMTAIVGVLFVEIIGRGPWSTAPFRVNPILPYTTLVVVGHAIYATFEYSRWRNFQKKGETGLLAFAPFDPLNLSNDYLRQSEVRNARLAMLANLGLWSQAAVTGKGPLDNLFDHLNDPGHTTIFSSSVGREVLAVVIFISVLPVYYEARKGLVPKDQQEEPFRPFPFLAPDKTGTQ